MEHWIYRASLDRFRLHDFIRDHGFVEYLQKGDIQVGDIVYLYITSPDKRIEYKMIVEKINIPFNDLFNTSSYSLAGVSTTTDVNEKFVRFNLIGHVQTNDLCFSELKKHGFNSNTMPPYCKIDGKIVEYIESMFELKPTYDADNSVLAGEERNKNNESNKLTRQEKLTLLSAAIAFVGMCVIPFIIYHLTYNRNNNESESQVPNQIERYKTDIEKSIIDIRAEFDPVGTAKDVDVKKHPDITDICKFQNSVRNLLDLQQAHDVCNFDAPTLQESCVLAKTNIIQRNNYDKTILEVFSLINAISKFGRKNGINAYMPYEQKKKALETNLYQWINKDTTENNNLYRQLEAIEKSNKSDDLSMFQDIVSNLIAYTEDSENYRNQRNLYVYLLEVKHSYDIVIRDYKIGM